jgi:hypothetical protein
MYEAIWGVYQANGGLLGELAYVAGKLVGRAHCSLCDITHGPLARKAAFKALEREMSVPIRLVHLNERSPTLRAATEGRTPCVVGEVKGEFDMLLDAGRLEDLDGSVAAFREALMGAIANRGSGAGAGPA